ncbi:chitinase [Penicillium malachiteum]|uniref:Chitinase n=1 Tax=Penicillium malachiteum TaxID=1324776 RepID=A0AAD6MW30_9EURO|nr:chitinase [Penicillium malachiteum]
MIIYDEDQWVSFLGDEHYAQRSKFMEKNNFLGIADWAIDLEKDYSRDPTGDDGSDSNQAAEICIFDSDEDDLIDFNPAKYQSSYCVSIAMMLALSKEFRKALSEYNAINQDYDEYFEYYKRYIGKTANNTLAQFMLSKESGKYFNCHYITSKNERTYPCPFEPGSFLGDYTARWEPTDQEGFEKLMSDKYNITPSWIGYATFSVPRLCVGCIDSGNWVDYPIIPPDANINNPKDIIGKSRTNMRTFQHMIDATYIDLMFGKWSGSTNDVLQTISMPIGKKEKKEETVELVLNILSAILLIVPYAGGLGAAAMSSAEMARIVRLVEAAANAGLAAYGVVENPESAPFAVLGMLLGSNALSRDWKSFATVSSVARKMDSQVLKDMGIWERSLTLEKKVNLCRA